MKKESLILYRDLMKQELFCKALRVMNFAAKKELTKKDKEILLEDMSELASDLLGEAHGRRYQGNLWHCYLLSAMILDENPYSLTWERAQAVDAGLLDKLAVHDFSILWKLYSFDFVALADWVGLAEYFAILGNYRGGMQGDGSEFPMQEGIAALEVSLRVCKDAGQFKDTVTEHYHRYGVGMFGQHRAFYIEDTGEDFRILPITNTSSAKLDDLVGYELPKKKLIDNTEAFIAGKAANNCLLFGDSGTGKSTCIKGLLNRYAGEGLRMIEIYKHQMKDIPKVLMRIKDRNYRFILVLDDLSFEEFEVEYKYLKAVIEGGLEQRPDNVRIYATSNRRHLIHEKFSDKKDLADDLHRNDTVQEKLSLASRFGVTIYFSSPDRLAFEEIVLELAKKQGIRKEPKQLLQEASVWEMSHGGLSGRTAQQFIDHLAGREYEDEDICCN